MPDLATRLRRCVRGGVYDDSRRRAEYSTDASNYRVVPQVVVEPMDVDDVLAVLEVSRTTGAPTTCRGGGTSVAGNAIGTGIVLDFSRHLNTVLDIDGAGRLARVQPGVVLDTLQQQAALHGLRFGPDPSSHATATLGGMLGNNACGPHAVAYGRTADNVVMMNVVDGRGRRFEAGPGTTAGGLDGLVDAQLEIVRTELGTFPRQISGYSLEHLLPEHGRNLAKALVGSEGTLAVTLDATVQLVPVTPARVLVVLGYPDMPAAADAVPIVLGHTPLAVEGLDARLVEVVRRHRGASAAPELPRGAGWLMVELGADTEPAAMAAAERLVRDAAPLAARRMPTGREATALWRIREDGAGLAGRTPRGLPAWPGWEDAAVPPRNLGAYLREFEELLASYDVLGPPYGHFGDGCVHVRLDLPLDHDGDVLRAFVLDAARLVVKHGGSCSGEHGDGRARSEVLSAMYSPRLLDLFAAVKSLFDPDNVLNPGVVVDPRRVDDDLRRPQASALPAAGGFSFGRDDADLTRAVHRCVGVGKCRADSRAAGGFMCPSYLATRDERDSTRGRARVLQELANGSLVRRWSSPEVHESLDLCLSCKACSRECPAGVDMAQYKSEALYRTYRGRVRPRTHYSLGWLPRWIGLAGRVPAGARLVNAALASRLLGGPLLRSAGVDLRRTPPRLAPVPFHRWSPRQLGARVQTSTEGLGRPVVLWVDSFTDGFAPGVAAAAVAVLSDAGYDVVLPQRQTCCGLTWIATGQLDGARSRLRRLLDVLAPYADQQVPIVGLEPSCLAVLRSDAADLLPDDPRTARVAEAVRTLAELLTGGGGPAATQWQPPDLSGREVVVQPHCHHHAVLGFDADRRLLEATGATVLTLAGCCGLAGSFGMESGHYDVSVAIAELGLLPAVRSAAGSAVVLADGFSCRTQIDDLAGRSALHLAELLAGGPASGSPLLG